MQQYFANLRQEVAPHGADPAAIAAAANVYRYGTLSFRTNLVFLLIDKVVKEEI